MLDQCPNPECGELQSYTSKGEVYYKTIGIEMPWVYDGVVMWRCPFCEFNWPRHEVWGRIHSLSWRRKVYEADKDLDI